MLGDCPDDRPYGFTFRVIDSISVVIATIDEYRFAPQTKIKQFFSSANFTVNGTIVAIYLASNGIPVRMEKQCRIT